ncbi:DUF262 domain-containing protein [Mucilaginibacter sp.]|uniref:DUF262 domain-containing protein n=1 Tax=Mucilaginibacter sp. TaxID=1882438 RepID=UPI00262B268A|nr:DUF262 domain-containing protein [Mucilaginibacter sp.]MDB5029459.1 hypothetical protein [Mucilaginibacter sp.]
MDYSINGTVYTEIDSIERISSKDSFTSTDNKLGTGAGAWEWHIGSKNDLEKYSFFGGSQFRANCFLLKQDLLRLMQELKPEYDNPSQEYRSADRFSELWTTRYNEILPLDDYLFFVLREHDNRAANDPRLYAKHPDISEGESNYDLIRKLALPNITYISIKKLSSDTGELLYYFKISCELPTKEIEKDSDVEKEDEVDNGGLYPYDPAYTDIEIGEEPYSVFEYLRQLDKDRINIQPDFQRNQIWSDFQKSQFIESIILNFPLPPIYLNQTKDNKFIVIDGLQRTTTIRDFYKGEYPLTGIKALPKYNGLYFEDLPEMLRSKFEDKKLTVFVLKPSTPMVVIYDLFNRINTGGTQLNRQEVRNCIFIGKSTRLLKELSAKEEFKEAIWWGVRDNRMKDREVVLRYLSFRWFDFENDYKGDMSDFLEISMRSINQMDDLRIAGMKADFIRTMEWSYKIWERENFRIPTEYTRGTINTAILESVGRYISFKSDAFLETNKKVMYDNYFTLIRDSKFKDAVTTSTSSKAHVFDRFTQAEIILNQGTND